MNKQNYHLSSYHQKSSNTHLNSSAERLYMYYLCSENKGADQLHGYSAADLHLYFSHMQKAGFLMKRLTYKHKSRNIKL